MVADIGHLAPIAACATVRQNGRQCDDATVRQNGRDSDRATVRPNGRDSDSATKRCKCDS